MMGLEGSDPETIECTTINSRYDTIVSLKRLELGGKKVIKYDMDRDMIWRVEPLPTHPNGMRFSVFGETGDLIATNEYFSVRPFSFDSLTTSANFTTGRRWFRRQPADPRFVLTLSPPSPRSLTISLRSRREPLLPRNQEGRHLSSSPRPNARRRAEEPSVSSSRRRPRSQTGGAHRRRQAQAATILVSERSGSHQHDSTAQRTCFRSEGGGRD